MSADLGSWWSDLTAAALVGTARRQVPRLPATLGVGRPDASREVALLDAAALGGALRVAGMRTRKPEPVKAADPDRRSLPPSRAVHLLELLLHQSPVGARLVPNLLQVWLDAADAGNHRIPHHLLPDLLELASATEQLRPAVRRAGDARGTWLAAVNPAWAWAASDLTPSISLAHPVDAEAWAQRPTDRRVHEVARLRETDPAAARGLVESTWGSDAANDRLTLLSTFRTGLGPDDESLLERALDDRSAKVRELASSLLDGLPTSARAARMAARLRPLLKPRGVLRRTLEVDLPDEPDPAGVRDGLTRPRGVGSVRGWWLQRLAAGAPLDVWTDVGRSDPEGAWGMVSERDARVGIVEAVRARGDHAWATTIVADVWHPDLLALIPAERLDAIATTQLVRATSQQVAAVVTAVPGPWGPAFSRAVLQRLTAEKEPAALIGQLGIHLATGLDPTTRPALDHWALKLEPGARERVARISQYLVLVLEIPEAFR
ncbi:MAG: DUF5691 domain-containing protein [Nocardioidaceae bacterium]